MFARRGFNHDKMVNFVQRFDLEADPDYEGMIPGTVTLDGYAKECNRFKRIIAAEPKPATTHRGLQKCRSCLELCLDGKYASKMLRSRLKDVESSM
jgi:hypothetical protein